jgi:apolipoprotein N-acyltransferase
VARAGFFLHFTHSLPPLAGLLWACSALAIAPGTNPRGIVPIPGLAYLSLPMVWGLFGVLPFVVDRLAASLAPGLWATLVFPVAWTTIEVFDAGLGPYGTWGASGYTQHGVMPLMQLASVTGVWGIGFVIACFAAVVNWARDESFTWSAVRDGVLILKAIVSGIVLIGGLRIALAPKLKAVRVAGIGWSSGIVNAG